MTVGLFGGSFDPIHLGHIQPVREARAALGLERVIYLPTARPPHKGEQTLAPALARYAMAELALLGEDGFEVSGFEFTPGRSAYTIDSLEHFAELYGEDRVVLLIGSDSLQRLDTWHRWTDIVGGYRIGVLTRPDRDRDSIRRGLPAELRQAEAAGRVHWVENSPVDVSATDVRRRLAAGEELPQGLVPDLVVEYLRKYPNLYA